MFKTLFIYILLFSSKVWNLFFIGLCFIPFRTFIYLEKYILVKNLWKFFNKFLIKKSQIIQFYLFLQYIFNFIYLLIIIFCFTIFIYLFILLLLEQFFFISSMFACNRLLLFFFIYFFSYLLFCGDDDFFNNFFELNFVDFRKDLHEKGEEWLFYFNEYHDLLDNEVDDFFTEYEWDFEESEFTSSAAEEEFITVEDTSNTNITYQDSILNDNLEYLDNLYFFERWLNLSTEVLDRIYYARYLLRIKDSIVKKKN